MDSLRREIKPEYARIFDRKADEEKEILCVLHSLKNSELEALVERGERLPGIHDVKGRISTLALLTDNPKYFHFH